MASDNTEGLRKHAASLIIALLCLLLSSCGGTDGAQSDKSKAAKPAVYRETIEECLIEVGVQFAVKPGDIAFLAHERRKHNVVERASKLDDQDGVVVRVLTARHGGPERWLLWYSQLPFESKSPSEIIKELPYRSNSTPTHFFVAFKIRAKPSFRHEIRRCVDFAHPTAN
jgi:hypothetical protein